MAVTTGKLESRQPENGRFGIHSLESGDLVLKAINVSFGLRPDDQPVSFDVGCELMLTVTALAPISSDGNKAEFAHSPENFAQNPCCQIPHAAPLRRGR